MVSISAPLMRFCVGEASLIVKNTFIGAQPECEPDSRKRSSSAPPGRVLWNSCQYPLLLAKASLLTGYKGSEKTEQKYQFEALTMGIIYLDSGSGAWSKKAPQSEQDKSCAESDCIDEVATTKTGGTSPSEDSLPDMQQSRIPCQSVGSAEHEVGNCRPCSWFWKESSCNKEGSCGFCHMCPDGAAKRRKHKNRALRRLKQVHTTGSVFELLLEKALPPVRGDSCNSKAPGFGELCKYAHSLACA